MLFYNQLFYQGYYEFLKLDDFSSSLIFDREFLQNLYNLIKMNVYQLYINRNQNPYTLILAFYDKFKQMYQLFF